MSRDRFLLRSGLLVDGTGARPGRADVLIADGRIAAIGDLGGSVEAAEIAADGRVVAPGFVDVHSHADFTILAFPSADSAVRQGVTTILTGNCGGGVAPASAAHDVRRVAFAYSSEWGVDVSWGSFASYLERVRGVAVNVAALVPHGAIRNAVMGLEARPPSRTELERMKQLLDEALASGGAGFSTGLEYQPGCYADAEEIVELTEVAARRGGLYATHMRNRAERFADATREALEVARRAGVRLQLSHVAPRPYAPRDQVELAFEAIESARGSGLEVWVDTFPEIWGPGTLADLFPREVTQGTPHEVMRRLRERAVRRMIGEFFVRGDNFLVRAGGYEQIFISSSPTRPEDSGRSLVDLAARAQTTVAELSCEMLLEAGPQLMSVGIRHLYATEDDLRRTLRLPNCSLGSDGVVTTGEGRECPFPWNASTYGYAPRTLAYYARDVGLFTIEEAVRRLSALPAQAIGLRDRGVLKEGSAADVVVFDLDRVRDRTTPEDMARHPGGIEHVFVNGAPAVLDGAPTGSRPGKVLSPLRSL